VTVKAAKVIVEDKETFATIPDSKGDEGTIPTGEHVGVG
jgi:hypothetical protein